MNPFLRAISALNQSGTRYVIVGGFAGYLHGTQRMTLDVDVVVDLDPLAARNAVDALLSAGFVCRLPVSPADFADARVREEWTRVKHMIVFSMFDPSNPGFAVDLFVEPPLPFDALFSSSQVVELESTKVRICDIPSLIEIKTRAGRPQDLLDVDSLRKIQSIKNQSKPQ